MDEVLEQVKQEIPRLRRFARVLTRNSDRADDLVQECLARAIKSIDRWQPGTNLRAWLFTIMHRLHLNELRRPTLASIEDFGPADPTPAVSGRQEEALELRDLQRAFDQLSESHKQVVLLIAIDGLDYDQVAEILGVKVTTVRTRLFRARAALSRHLERAQPAETQPDRETV